ncbi:hypothetical protein SAVIM338S_01591 [Streptomyces avidinii]
MERSGPDGSVWTLVRRQDGPLGVVTVESADFPWLYGRFAPEPGFEQVRPWFEAVQSVLAEEIDGERFGERFDAVYEPIAEQLTLVMPDGVPASDFLLHIDGAEAWFRWSD